MGLPRSDNHLMVVHQRRDGRWVVSREKDAWRLDGRGRLIRIHGKRVRKEYKTGGDHAGWQCAKSWAEAYLRRMVANGWKPIPLVVEKAA